MFKHLQITCSQKQSIILYGTLQQLQYLIIFPVDQSQFELELCWVNGKDPGLTLTVQAIDTVTLHHGDVDGQVQCPYYSSITKHNNAHMIFVMIIYSRLILYTTNGHCTYTSCHCYIILMCSHSVCMCVYAYVCMCVCVCVHVCVHTRMHARVHMVALCVGCHLYAGTRSAFKLVAISFVEVATQ